MAQKNKNKFIPNELIVEIFKTVTTNPINLQILEEKLQKFYFL